MRVVTGRAVGEFRHVQRAQPDAPRVLKACDRGRCCRRHETLAQLRSAFGELSFDVVHVLMRQWDAVQRSLGVAAPEHGIGGCGRGKSLLRLQPDEGIERGLPHFDAIKQRAGDFDRRHLAFAKGSSGFGDGEFEKLGHLSISSISSISWREIAVKLDGSTSSPMDGPSAVNRVTAGVTARATRAHESGSIGMRAAAAMTATRSGRTSSDMRMAPGECGVTNKDAG